MSEHTSSSKLLGTKRDSVEIFAALGDPTRFMLVVTLSDGQPRSIVQLASSFYLSRQAITKHLRVLEKVGVVRSSRVGRESQFAYVSEPIEDARSCLDEVSAQWDDALSRLKSFTEQ